MFDIDFTDETIDIEDGILHRGVITLGGKMEDFSSSLSYWSKDDYRQQWLEAATCLLEPDARSAFITNIHDPQSAKFIRWWPAWRSGDFVVLQEQFLPLDINFFEDADIDVDEELKARISKFSIENPYLAVGDRLATHCQECQKTGICRRPRLGKHTSVMDDIEICPSEWGVQLYLMEEFIDRRKIDWTK